MQLKKAVKQKVKAKIGLFGVSGAGKTKSALRLAYGLCGDWDKIALIDTEYISDETTASQLYAGYKGDGFEIGEFNVLQLKPPYAPERLASAIWECEQAGMEVIIIDSLSAFWEGPGGCLEVAKKFNDWKEVGEAHSKMIEKIKQSPCHIVACARAKTKYETFNTVNKAGKETVGVKKIGTGIITREGFDYELIIALDIDHSHLSTASKDRTGLFVGRTPFLITEEVGQEFIAWAENGQLEPISPEKEIESLKSQINAVIDAKQLDKSQLPDLTGVRTLDGQPVEVYRTVLEKLSA